MRNRSAPDIRATAVFDALTRYRLCTLEELHAVCSEVPSRATLHRLLSGRGRWPRQAVLRLAAYAAKYLPFSESEILDYIYEGTVRPGCPSLRHFVAAQFHHPDNGGLRSLAAILNRCEESARSYFLLTDHPPLGTMSDAMMSQYSTFITQRASDPEHSAASLTSYALGRDLVRADRGRLSRVPAQLLPTASAYLRIARQEAPWTGCPDDELEDCIVTSIDLARHGPDFLCLIDDRDRTAMTDDQHPLRDHDSLKLIDERLLLARERRSAVHVAYDRDTSADAAKVVDTACLMLRRLFNNDGPYRVLDEAESVQFLESCLPPDSWYFDRRNTL